MFYSTVNRLKTEFERNGLTMTSFMFRQSLPGNGAPLGANIDAFLKRDILEEIQQLRTFFQRECQGGDFGFFKCVRCHCFLHST